MRRVKRALMVGAAVAVFAIGVTALGDDSGSWEDCDAEQGVLPIEVQEVVLEALLGTDGGYAAYAMYAAIVEKHGDVRPISNIMASEAKQIESLKQILDRYGVGYLEENPYLGMIEAPDSLAEAAQAGVDAEISNVALYARQLETVADYPDVLELFVNLQAASQENHLPAFQRAAARFLRNPEGA